MTRSDTDGNPYQPIEPYHDTIPSTTQTFVYFSDGVHLLCVDSFIQHADSLLLWDFGTSTNHNPAAKQTSIKKQKKSSHHHFFDTKIPQGGNNCGDRRKTTRHPRPAQQQAVLRRDTNQAIVSCWEPTDQTPPEKSEIIWQNINYRTDLRQDSC